VRSTKLPSSIERLLGLGSPPPPPNVFALSAEALRHLSVRRERGALMAVEDRHWRRLEPEAFHQGPLGGPPRDLVAFKGIVAELAREAGGVALQASLVLPDRFMRLGFLEMTDLPDAPQARLAALRFKLKQQVPFRVDELRIVGHEVKPLPGQDEPRRMVVAFAAEVVLQQLEQAFSEAQVRIGLITNESLALSAAIAEPATRALLIERPGSYSLLIEDRGEPVLYRFKSYEAALPEAAREAMVRRELRLLRTFLAERLPERPLEAGLVLSEQDSERWLRFVREELQIDAVPVASDRIVPPKLGLPAGWSWSLDGPLLGAALMEVA
jgi:hypothetical protein